MHGKGLSQQFGPAAATAVGATDQIISIARNHILLADARLAISPKSQPLSPRVRDESGHAESRKMRPDVALRLHRISRSRHGASHMIKRFPRQSVDRPASGEVQA